MILRKISITTLVLLVPVLGSILVFTKNNQIGDRVVKIIDGDTFKLENKQTVRLASIDAPEIGNCYSQEAKLALEKLILNKKVILIEPYADNYGRIISIVISDGQIINELMVRNGLAVDTYDKILATKAIKEANSYARKNNLGIYSEQCSQVVPPNLNCVIKGNLDQRENRKLYSYLGCGNYDLTVVELFSGDKWFCSEKEAIKAGYTKRVTAKANTNNLAI